MLTLETEEGNEKGFSLVELLVVVAILAILATIAIPLFLNQKNKASDQVIVVSVRSLIPEGIAAESGGVLPSGATLKTLINNSGWAGNSPGAYYVVPNCTLNGSTTASQVNGHFLVVGARTISPGSGAWVPGGTGTQIMYDSQTRKWYDNKVNSTEFNNAFNSFYNANCPNSGVTQYATWSV